MEPTSGTKRFFSQREDEPPVARKKTSITSSSTPHALSSTALEKATSSQQTYSSADIRNYFLPTTPVASFFPASSKTDESASPSEEHATSVTSPAFSEQSTLIDEEEEHEEDRSDTETVAGPEVYDSGLESEFEETEIPRNQKIRSGASSPLHGAASPLFHPPWGVDDEIGPLPTEIKEIPPTINQIDYIARKQVHRDRLACGHGSCGKVYATTIEGHVNADGSPIPYLYKAPTQRISLDDWGSKPHRYSDLAAARLDDLPHIVKPLFLIVSVRTSPGEASRRFYVPLEKAKEFGNALPPGSHVEILGQVIPKAPGENLQTLIERDKNLFNPSGPHFKAIMVGLSKFLIAAYPHNFIHRDLKPENIIYDPASQTVTIIDTGLSLRLRRRGKEDEEVKGPSNPVASKQHFGTPDFRSPFVLRPDGYGSEIDFHGMALIALSLISNSDFELVSNRRLIENRIKGTAVDILFRRIPPTEFLNHYMSLLSSHGAPTTTSTALEAHPEVKQLIELCFQISAGGVAGNAALEQFKALPYFQRAS